MDAPRDARSGSAEPVGPLVVAAGPLRAQARLLAEVAEAIVRGRGDPHALTRPLRVVVPSQTLREHLAAALVRSAGRSIAGLEIATHRALAFRVLECAGEPAPRGEALLPVLVRRCAREERALHERLDGLDDGYGVVVAAVRDLLDAGFDRNAHGEALDEWLAAHPGPDALVERARAALRVAARTAAALERLGLADRSELLRRATHLLRSRGAALLPTRALWIHGFADVTGVVADWLEALQRVLVARVVLSVPPVPGGGDAVERRFSERFRERFAAAAGEECDPASPPTSTPRRLRAAGSEAELRAVAVRIRRLLDSGARPEGIAVVGRAPAGYRAALRSQFGRLAIPFSAPSLRAPGGPAARRVHALVALLEHAGRAPVERWLDAHAHEPGPDVRTALHAVGAARLEDLATLDLDERLGAYEALRLPVPLGLAPASDELRPDSGMERVQRVRIGRARLATWRERAARFLERLERASRRVPVAGHARSFRGLATALGWRADALPFTPLFDAVRELAAQLAGAPPLEPAEWTLLLRGALEAPSATPAGGRGGGVQVLSVMEARGLSFEHLFVVGMNRDVFPRPIVEDPLLPDALRRGLRALLPDLPVKAAGHDEERHHFAELLASSPQATLSWQFVSDDGRERVASPLLVRLELGGNLGRPETAPSVLASGAPEDPRPAREQATLAALHGSRRQLGRVLAVALAEVTPELGPGAGDADALADLARARMALLDELDPLPGDPRARTLGPFYGLVGRPRPGADGAGTELHVTHVERLARCPWQMFLERRLGLETAPDARAALPTLDRRRLGNVVHDVLERIVTRGWPDVPRTLASAALQQPVAIAWPDAATLEKLVRDATWRQLRDDGLPARELARLLAHRARAVVEEAQRVEWSDGPVPVVGVEVTGWFEMLDGAGRPRRVGFRADRIDRRDGRLRLTDYKTGKPIHTSANPSTRRKHFLRSVAGGRTLQAAAYAEGASSQALPADGRFVYLHEGLDPALREWTVRPDDRDLRERLAEVCRVALDAVDSGASFPRLVDPSGAEPATCRTCELREACLQGETAHRRRLEAWLREDAEGALLGAWRALWDLGRAPAEDAR